MRGRRHTNSPRPDKSALKRMVGAHRAEFLTGKRVSYENRVVEIQRGNDGKHVIPQAIRGVVLRMSSSKSLPDGVA